LYPPRGDPLSKRGLTKPKCKPLFRPCKPPQVSDKKEELLRSLVFPPAPSAIGASHFS
jgi:hypothetical protein